jgi:hypothetical protein
MAGADNIFEASANVYPVASLFRHLWWMERLAKEALRVREPL